MKLTGRGSLASLLNIFMLGLMIFALGVILCLPWITNWYLKIVYFPFIPKKGIYYFVLVILYVCGIFSILILKELKKIFKTCKLNDPFIYENVKSLKRISFGAIVISLFFITKLFLINSFMTMIVIFVFMLAALFALILSEVFEKAIDYKIENDLTI